MANRPAFTLIEVLIAIALLALILPGLYKTTDTLHLSNEQLFDYVEKSKEANAVGQTLYLDILGSDGNITIVKDEFSRVCIEKTVNSLYGLPMVKVCWVVVKEKNTLVRVEGNGYTLPMNIDEKAEIDPLIENIEIFDIYHKEDKVLVLVKEKSKESMSFLVQGVKKFVPPPKPKKKGKRKQRDTNQTVERVGEEG